GGSQKRRHAPYPWETPKTLRRQGRVLSLFDPNGATSVTADHDGVDKVQCDLQKNAAAKNICPNKRLLIQTRCPPPMTPTAASPLAIRLHPKAGDRQHWSSLHGSAVSLAVASAARELQQPVLWVTRDTASARRIEQELRFFADDLAVLHLPDWETLPYDTFSPHQDIISERLATLYSLPELKRGVLVVPVTTLLHRLPPPAYLLGSSLMIDKGQRIDIDQLGERLASARYRAVPTVYSHGEFAQRGALFG